MKQVKEIGAKDNMLAWSILAEYFPDLTAYTLIESIKEHGGHKEGILLTYSEAAERWSCSKRHIQYLCEQGELMTVKIGPRAIRIPESELLKKLEILKKERS